jgi:hypothetical protein
VEVGIRLGHRDDDVSRGCGRRDGEQQGENGHDESGAEPHLAKIPIDEKGNK